MTLKSAKFQTKSGNADVVWDFLKIITKNLTFFLWRGNKNVHFLGGLICPPSIFQIPSPRRINTFQQVLRTLSLFILLKVGWKNKVFITLGPWSLVSLFEGLYEPLWYDPARNAELKSDLPSWIGSVAFFFWEIV